MTRYRVLVADCPWKFDDKLPGNRGVQDSIDGTTGGRVYRQRMSVEQLMSLHVPPTYEDSILFMWRVAAMVEEALMVCKAWGFQNKSEIVWVKTKEYEGLEPPPEPDPPRLGTGHYVRLEHEVCIIATKGQASSLIDQYNVRSVIFSPRGEHSEKPKIFFELLDQLLGRLGPRAELFARKERHGYDCFGDEIGKPLSWGLFYGDET